MAWQVGQHALYVLCVLQVENPIPYADSRLTRVLTTGYLHARYFGQMVLPVWMSADWSFNCIPMVEKITDPRNAATLALYGYVAYVIVASRPWQLLQQLLSIARCAVFAVGPDFRDAGELQGGSSAGMKQSDTAATSSSVVKASLSYVAESKTAALARWRLLVVVGLLIAPFLPASNVLFYVGTFIGERLLYVPSIGFCFLLAELLGMLVAVKPPARKELPEGQQQVSPECVEQAHNTHNSDTQTAAKAAAGSSAVQSSTGGTNSKLQEQGDTASSAVRELVALLLLLLLSAAYAGRTVVRNMDWWDEERLFLSAERVCPNSAKVQQNCGVLMRRYQNFDAAQKHFRSGHPVMVDWQIRVQEIFRNA